MSDKTRSISRRGFLKLLGGGMASLAFTGGRAYGKSVVTIGLQVELTGGLATYGYWHLKSARAAVKKVNDEGGIGGREVKLVYGDTETNPSVGSRVMNRLILREGANFMIGSQHSGVCLASVPLAKRFAVPYFPIGEATDITGSEGNEYVFRSNYSVKAHAKSGYGWVMENLGTNWTVVYADYAMGQSAVAEWSTYLRDAGGNLVGEIPIPQGTDDFGPYLKKVDPDETDVLFIILYGPDALACLRRIHEMGLDEDVNTFGNTGSVEALDVDFPGAEGLYSITNYPRRSVDVPRSLQGFDEEFRDRVGVGPDGRDPKNGKIVDSSHYWVPWENTHFIRDAVRSCGWQGDRDTGRLIDALAGTVVWGSDSHPQGSKYIRAVDHQGFHSQYIQQVQGGRLSIVAELPPEDGEYEPLAVL
ncbi:MAG: ABC transporter substrate-binding protein [Candidatus Acetothermia bacterium]